MCIIIDTNTFTSVLDKSSQNHEQFKPVLDWVLEGRGVFVYGGTKYLRELGKGKYLTFFSELTKVRKAKNIDRATVDQHEASAAASIQHADFDDQHLVGLLLASGCKLICSLDERAYPYLTHSNFFSPASRKPKIYSRKTNADLLTDVNLAEICRPAAKLTNSQKEGLSILK